MQWLHTAPERNSSKVKWLFFTICKTKVPYAVTLLYKVTGRGLFSICSENNVYILKTKNLYIQPPSAFTIKSLHRGLGFIFNEEKGLYSNKKTYIKSLKWGLLRNSQNLDPWSGLAIFSTYKVMYLKVSSLHLKVSSLHEDKILLYVCFRLAPL